MQITIPSWLSGVLTAAVGGAVTVVPLVVPFIPPPYNIAASAGLAFLSGMYHLYKDSPSATQIKIIK